VQIRVNQVEAGVFSYAQEAQKGRNVVDLQKNIISKSIIPGTYAKSVVKQLSSGIFQAIKFADSISKVMSAYSVNINEASNLININKPDFSAFENTEELYNTITIAESKNYETQSVANNLWANHSQFKFNEQQNLGVFSFIYKNISAAGTRIEIIKKIIDNAELFGMRTDNANNFCEDINSKANFMLANYYDYLKTEGLASYVAKNQNSFLKLFMAFDFLIRFQSVKNSFQTKKYDDSEEIATVKSIMQSAFKRQSISDLDLLINSANSHVNGSGAELLSVVFKETIKETLSSLSIRFAFDILQRLRSKADIADIYLLLLINAFSNKEEFMKAYISDQNNDPNFYAKFEKEKAKEPLIVDFFKKKDMFSFTSQPLSASAIKKYFDSYYAKGVDALGLFVKRLEEYFRGIQQEQRIKECVNMLNMLKLPSEADKKLLLPVHCIIIEAFFSAPYSKIYDMLISGNLRSILEIYNALGSGLKQNTASLALTAICGEILLKGEPKQEDIDSLAKNFDAINSQESIDIINQYYFPHIASILIVKATSEAPSDYDSFLKRVFGKVIDLGDIEKITDSIVDSIKKSKVDKNIFILYIFKKHLENSKNKIDKKLGDIANLYFEKLSSGERKKTFAELLAMAEDKEEAALFSSYFDDFNKQHKSGFFDFLKKKI
jgi:hypothetical protein